MAAATDIKSDSDGDLFIDPNTGDLKISLSDEQHIFDILDSFVGHWKEFPSLGVGIKQYQGSAGKEQEISRSIKLQLQGDGYVVDNPIVFINNEGKMVIDPKAIRK